MKNVKNKTMRLLCVLMAVIMVVAVAPQLAYANTAPETIQSYRLYWGRSGSDEWFGQYYVELTFSQNVLLEQIQHPHPDAGPADTVPRLVIPVGTEMTATFRAFPPGWYDLNVDIFGASAVEWWRDEDDNAWEISLVSSLSASEAAQLQSVSHIFDTERTDINHIIIVQMRIPPIVGGDVAVIRGSDWDYVRIKVTGESTPQAPVATPAPTPTPTPPPAAAPSAWAAEHVQRAITLNLVPANLQSAYTQAATRAEFAALAVALYETITGNEITGRVTFTDTTDVNVQKLAYLGVVDGMGDGTFAPNSQLTREQAAVLLARLAGAIDQPFPTAAPTFTDNAAISSWAQAGVGQAQAAGVMGGVGDNIFSPQGSFTREQSIIAMLRLFDFAEQS